MTFVITSPSIAAPRLRDQLEAKYRDQTLRCYQSGQMIPLETQKIWVVCRGVVLLSTIYTTGEEALLGLAGPSTAFGLPLSQVEPYQATALSAVDLIQMSMAEVEHSPSLNQDLFRSLNRRLQQAEMMLALLGQRRVEDRLHQFLLLLKQEVGQPVAEGTRFNVRLTHQHLANALGTTRVTVTRLLGQLRKEGLLRIDQYRHIILSDRF
jgi:CRP-like cAMP-binding protein